MDKISQLKQTIQQAVPSLSKKVPEHCPENHFKTVYREIHLADVLEAIGRIHPDFVMPLKLTLNVLTLEGGIFWNLSLALDHQSPETLDFLYSILCN